MPDALVPQRRWAESTIVDGLQFRWGTDGNGFIAEWEGVVVVHADAAGTVTRVVAAPGASEHLVQKLSEGGATAFGRSRVGKLSLHASAVSDGRAAIVCVGPSGAGKSTLASALCTRPGVELMADDVAGLDHDRDGWSVVPTESRHWLVTTTQESKESVAPSRVASRTAPLRAIVTLAFDDTLAAPVLRQLRGGDVMLALMDAPIRYSLAPDSLRREFDALGKLGAETAVFELKRPRASALESTARLVYDLLAAGVPSRGSAR